MKTSEFSFLKSIHLKILILTGIVMPAVTGTAAYYNLKMKIEEKDRQVSERISQGALSDQKSFVTKEQFEKLTDKVDVIGQDVTEIKTILKARHR